jgi:hypothetical protein
VLAARGQAGQAAKYAGAVDRALEAIGHTMPPRMGSMFERTIAAARAALGEPTFTAAWAEGRATTLEQAVAYALEGRADA